MTDPCGGRPHTVRTRNPLGRRHRLPRRRGIAHRMTNTDAHVNEHALCMHSSAGILARRTTHAYAHTPRCIHPAVRSHTCLPSTSWLPTWGSVRHSQHTRYCVAVATGRATLPCTVPEPVATVRVFTPIHDTHQRVGIKYTRAHAEKAAATHAIYLRLWHGPARLKHRHFRAI